MVEQVLVFHAQRLEHYLKFFQGGVISDRFLIEDMLDEFLRPGVAFYMDRDKAEVDPSFKQVIPYCVLTKDARQQYFVYKRTKKGSEARLHDLWSVGVGGHINPCDSVSQTSYDDYYTAALRRELQEEVSVNLGPDLSQQAPVVALIYDPSNDVGKVHFGVVHIVHLGADAQVQSSDPALANGMWMSREGLASSLDYFENWSRLVISCLLLE